MTTPDMGAIAPAMPEAPSDATKAERLVATIEGWFVELIHNSPVSRDTEAFNHCRCAVDALERRLLGEI